MKAESLHIARFLALMGILFVSLHYAFPPLETSAFRLWAFTFLDGRAAALLVMLLGIQFGMSAVTMPVALKQGALLFVVGILLMAIYPAALLALIGLSLIVGAAARHYLPKYLPWVSLAIVLIWPLMALIVDFRAGWSLSGYGDLWSPAGFLRNTLFNGWYPVIPWAAFFTFGMWLSTLDLPAKSTPRRLAVGGLFGAMIFKALSGIASSDKVGLSEAAGLSPLPANPIFVGFTLAACLSALGVILWIAPKLGPLANLLAVPGEMPFTLYVLMVVIVAFLPGILPFGPGILTVQIGATLLLFAHIWTRFMPAGPLEGLLAKLR